MSLFWSANGNMSNSTLSDNSYNSVNFRPSAGVPCLRYKVPDSPQPVGQLGGSATACQSLLPASTQYTQMLGMPNACGKTQLLQQRQFFNPLTQQKMQQHHQQHRLQKPTYIVPKLGFRGVNLSKIIKKLGSPNLTDPSRGGIAIWNHSGLQAAGYPYLFRAEVIDEKVASIRPVPHIANVYIWVKIPMSNCQMDRVLDLSDNFLYDQYKKLFIVRSKCLNTAIAMAALIKHYAKGKVSMYQINNHNLLKTYFMTAHKSKAAAEKFKKVLKSP